jgi:SanA protein
LAKFLKLSRKRKLIVALLTKVVGLLVVTLFTGLINLLILTSTANFRFETKSVLPHKQTVMILGAKVHDGGRLSDMLRDRTETAFEVYESGKAQKILVSGDHGRKSYDEVNAIKDYLLEKGVPKEDLFLDHAGFDTYDSMYRAREIFQIESLIISTQEFHLARSVYIARELDLDAVGIKADKQDYYGHDRAKVREVLARVKSFMDVLLHSKPKFLGDAIPITGDSSLSWDEEYGE